MELQTLKNDSFMRKNVKLMYEIDQNCLRNHNLVFSQNQELRESSIQSFEKSTECQINSTLFTISEIQEEGDENDNLQQKFLKISKSNISKNIIKAFFNYLLDKNNDLLISFAMHGVQAQNAQKLAKNFVSCYVFNNNYLQKLIQHTKYGKAFEYYLTFEAENWLYKSKVQHKDDHLVYINFLKLCCSNPKYSELLISYKKGKKTLFNIRD
ncbi:hypothetical protein ABPG74_015467 [Tetrahymena malaccensis]